MAYNIDKQPSICKVCLSLWLDSIEVDKRSGKASEGSKPGSEAFATSVGLSSYATEVNLVGRTLVVQI